MNLYRRWQRSRLKIAQCERCGRRLTRKQMIEITDTQRGKFGFTSITATFCKRDAPEVRAA